MALEDVLNDILDGHTGEGVISTESDLVAPKETVVLPSLDGITEKIEQCNRDRIALESFSVEDNCTKALAMEVFTMLGALDTEKIVTRLTSAPSKHNTAVIASVTEREISRLEESKKALEYDVMFVRNELKTRLTVVDGKVVSLRALNERVLELCRKGVKAVMTRVTVDLCTTPLTRVSYYSDELYCYEPFNGRLAKVAELLIRSSFYGKRFTETSSLYDVGLHLQTLLNCTEAVNDEGGCDDTSVRHLTHCKELVELLESDVGDFIHHLEVLTDVLSS